MAGHARVTVEELCDEGDRLLRAGQDAAAAAKYSEALGLDAGHFHALSSLGFIALERDQLDDAISYLERACASHPTDVTSRLNLGNALARCGRFTDAVTAYDMVLRATPNDATVLCSRSSALLYAGRVEAAIEGYQQVLRREPNHRVALFNLAKATLKLNRYGDCANICLRLLATNAVDLDIFLILLTALSAARRLDDAAEPIERAIEAATVLLDRAGAARPDLPPKLLHLAQLLIELEEPRKALGLIEHALRTFASEATLHVARGQILVRLMRQSEAIDSFDRALVLDRTSTEALIERGTTLAQLGQFDKAINDCDRALSIGSGVPSILIELVGFKTFKATDDRHLATIEDQVARADTLSAQDQTYVHFAAGKAYDDLGRYDEAFEQWRRGNWLKRQTLSYDVEADVSFNDEIIANLTREWMQGRTGERRGASPIFVFGMPRSGTTLVEQLIGAHPEAAAMGETGFVQRAVRHALRDDRGPKSSVERAKPLSSETLRRLGEGYLDQLRERTTGGAPRVVDKTLANARYAGLIAAALPNAVMIHVRRNPLDNCLACFAKHFVNGNKFTYDLDDLAKYRQSHDRLMRHWRNALPSDRFLEVDYEDLVANFASEAQRIIAFCGFDWTDAVLDFANVSRAVTTASAFQVRQGLYATSVGRWHHYQRQLAPLQRALDVSRSCIAAAR